MNKNVKTVAREKSIYDAAKLMKDGFVASLIVVENNSPVGIITERDICYKVVAMSKDPLRTKVDEVMTRTLITAHMEDTVSEVSRRMGLAKVKQIPIIDNNRSLAGIVTSTDLIRIISHLQKDLGSIMEPHHA